MLAAVCALSCESARLEHYWDNLNVQVDDYAVSRDRFARFAELAYEAPEQKAMQAVSSLMDKLLADEVSYYVYADWMAAAFHSIYSPCRYPALFAGIVERMESDGILTESDLEPLRVMVEKDRFNLPGEACSLPTLTASDGTPAQWTPGEATLFAVVNLDCSSCMAALNALGGEKGKHIALCFGRTAPSPLPEWEYMFMSDPESIFEVEAAPFWFSVDEKGLVQKPYSPAPGSDDAFAKPDIL